MIFAVTNSDTVTIARCQPVAILATPTTPTVGGAVLADSDLGIERYRVFGLVSASAAPGASLTVQTEGRFQATTDEWDEVTGEQGGLTVAALYYLTRFGRLTKVRPDSGVPTQVGFALSTTKMNLRIQEPPVTQEVQDTDLRVLVEALLLEQQKTNALLQTLVAGMDASDPSVDEAGPNEGT